MENEKREITELEEELKKLSPVKSQISRDDLFFKAGLAASERDKKSRNRLRLWQSYSAATTLSTLFCFGWILQGIDSSKTQPENQPVANVPSSIPSVAVPKIQKNEVEGKMETHSVKLVEPARGSYLSLTRLYLKNLEEGKRPERMLESDIESHRREPSLLDQQPGSYRDLMQEMLESRGDSQI